VDVGRRRNNYFNYHHCPGKQGLKRKSGDNQRAEHRIIDRLKKWLLLGGHLMDRYALWLIGCPFHAIFAPAKSIFLYKWHYRQEL
jgi:hypothetical protein